MAAGIPLAMVCITYGEGRVTSPAVIPPLCTSAGAVTQRAVGLGHKNFGI